MPARIVVVHDESEFVEQMAAALRQAGHDVVASTSPMAALDALETAERVEVLVTRVDFPPGTLNGIALARMAHLKCPGIKVLFASPLEHEEAAEGLGDFISLPLNLPDLLQTVDKLLE